MHKELLDVVGERLGIKTMDDWYKTSFVHASAAGAGGILVQYVKTQHLQPTKRYKALSKLFAACTRSYLS
jgi:hypothetical protein